MSQNVCIHNREMLSSRTLATVVGKRLPNEKEIRQTTIIYLCSGERAAMATRQWDKNSNMICLYGELRTLNAAILLVSVLYSDSGIIFSHVLLLS